MKIKPMLGENIINCSSRSMSRKMYRISEKIDGVRRLIYKNLKGEIVGVSRTNHADPWIGHIYEFLEAPWFPSNRVYDCELVDRDAYTNNVPCYELRRITNSKASQQFPDNKKDLMAICFDIYMPNGDLRPAYERDAELYSLFNRGKSSDPIIRVPTFGNVCGYESEVIKDIMDSVVRRGGEGLMLLDLESIYIPGRTKNLLKVKKMKDFEGRVIDYEMAREGTKIEGMVAAIICEVDGCNVPVRVGSGFNNNERQHMVEHSPIGKIVEIEAFSFSKNKNGGTSLNFPIFKRFVE